MPLDLVTIAGHPEIKYSLRTKNYRQANALIHAEAAKVQARFDAFRASRRVISSSESPADTPGLEQARDWFSRSFAKHKAALPLVMDDEHREVLLENFGFEQAVVDQADPLELSRSSKDAKELLGAEECEPASAPARRIEQ